MSILDKKVGALGSYLKHGKNTAAQGIKKSSLLFEKGEKFHLGEFEFVIDWVKQSAFKASLVDSESMGDLFLKPKDEVNVKGEKFYVKWANRQKKCFRADKKG